jgi:hypothetical protein
VLVLCCFDLLQPEYLESAGFAARGLLTSPAPKAESAAANFTVADDAASTAGSSSDGAAAAAPGVFEQLQAKVNEGIAKIGEGVESVGNAVVKLGRWMRSQLTGEAYVDDGEASRKGDRPGSKAAGVMGAVMVVMVAIVAVVLLRRPGPARHSLFVRLFRRA